MPNNKTIKLFYSYSHKDEVLHDELEVHLKLLQRQKIINTWHDRKITTGTEWKQTIDKNLETAHIILLLVSADFLASDYCYDIEIQHAMKKHQEGSAIVIPISLRPCDTTDIDFMTLQGLPKDFRPIIKGSIEMRLLLILQKVSVLLQKKSNTQNIQPHRIKILFLISPIPRNPLFTGRSDILASLNKSLQNDKEIVIKQSEKATALSGLGGVGKTHIVVEYAHRYRDNYSAVLWVASDGIDLLRNSFAELSSLLGFPLKEQKDQIEAVQLWLIEHQDWLLIFDNAETLDVLTAARDMLPVSFDGHVLFTTRAQATETLASVLVDCFDLKEGVIFLLRRCKFITKELGAVAVSHRQP